MPTYKSIDHYIASFPNDIRGILETLRKTIREEVPNSEESISYNMPTISSQGKYIIYFSGWKNHVSIYPFSADMEREIKETKEFKMSGKGTIQFPYDEPLPLQLIRKITRFLVKKNLQ